MAALLQAIDSRRSTLTCAVAAVAVAIVTFAATLELGCAARSASSFLTRALLPACVRSQRGQNSKPLLPANVSQGLAAAVRMPVDWQAPRNCSDRHSGRESEPWLDALAIGHSYF